MKAQDRLLYLVLYILHWLRITNRQMSDIFVCHSISLL